MARPYSSDLRERVVEAVDEGATRLEAAERFGVSVSSAVRWHQAWRETGTLEAKSCGGSCSPVGVTRQRCWKYDWVLEFDIKGLLDASSHYTFGFFERVEEVWSGCRYLNSNAFCP